jgi:peptide-methionine (S)-S-oxide reductase
LGLYFFWNSYFHENFLTIIDKKKPPGTTPGDYNHKPILYRRIVLQIYETLKECLTKSNKILTIFVIIDGPNIADIMKRFLVLFSFFIFSACTAQQGSFATIPPLQNNEAIAYFASGCFWCVEGVYEQVKGVHHVISGYAGGRLKKPSYYQHGNHTETVLVIYDTEAVSYKQLVQVFFEITNPYTLGQEPDFGASYRSALFPKVGEQTQVIKGFLEELKGHKIDVIPFDQANFHPAENYHQDYVSRLESGQEVVNPGYGINVSIPRRNAFVNKTAIPLKTKE